MIEDSATRGERIRRSPIAGSWYPGRSEALSHSVRELLDSQERVHVARELVALISPHAGLRYSGPVAAAGYRLLEQYRFDTAVLLGPSHYVHFQGASIFPRGAFETPLGRIAVDEELAAVIEGGDRRITYLAEAHEREHSLEMQLPFLQVLVPELAIVPIVMGDQRRENVEAVAAALGDAVAGSTKRILLIASSDLSHFKPESIAARMDGEVRRLVEELRVEDLMELVEQNREHACGGGPMVAVMLASRSLGASTVRTMRYGDSGDITGDKSEVVGYLSAAVFK
jgi:AmmeMemoRadiSam system protein B